MTLNRKGLRRITVDGVPYRWKVRPRATECTGLNMRPFTYAVSHDGPGGAILVVTTNHFRPDNWFDAPAPPVLPADVAATIRLALARGWEPAADGSSFHLDLRKTSGRCH